MANFIVFKDNVIVAEVSSAPNLAANSGYQYLPDTEGNRAYVASLKRPLTQRQLANAEFMKLPDVVRGQFALAWVAINSRLDANDKTAALAFFDTLVIPSEFFVQAQIIREAISNS